MRISTDKYINGLDMSKFKHIPEISCYGNNYYIGFKQRGYAVCDLIYGESDDDNTTQWFIINLDGGKNVQIGRSYCSNGNKLEAL